ncbi:hypothetical protein GF377_04100 [candidate division GN15 bacterium]|nr:hypothetical protein [candidate division GN15 bacterium]
MGEKLMTDRLYYLDPTLLEFTGRVVTTNEEDGNFFTRLDRSAFYPTSGGQPHDLGTLNGVPLIDVIESVDGDVVNVSKQPVGAPGDDIKGIVDAARRKINRCNHTAHHILSSVFHRLADLKTVSVHLGLEYGAVEFETDQVSTELIEQAEAAANQMVQDNLPIDILMVDKEEVSRLPLRKPPAKSGKLRVIKIGDVEYVACGGTHCSSTAEVLVIKIIGTEKLRGHPLVKFLAGPLAVRDYVERFDVTDSLSREMTCHVLDLPARFQKLSNDNQQLNQALTDALKTLMPIRAQMLTQRAEVINATKVSSGQFDDIDMQLAARLAGDVADHIRGVVLIQTQDKLCIATAEGVGHSAADLAKGLTAKTGVKGGGNDRLARMGSANPDLFAQYRDAFQSLIESA